MVISTKYFIIIKYIENDAMVDQVYNSVRSIKKHAMEMNNKIRLSNQQCEEMDKKYSDSNSLMNKTIKQLGELFSANTGYWCYLMIFIFVVLFFLYKITH